MERKKRFSISSRLSTDYRMAQLSSYTQTKPKYEEVSPPTATADFKCMPFMSLCSHPSLLQLCGWVCGVLGVWRTYTDADLTRKEDASSCWAAGCCDAVVVWSFVWYDLYIQAIIKAYDSKNINRPIPGLRFVIEAFFHYNVFSYSPPGCY
jgi:hypothetical protein